MLDSSAALDLDRSAEARPAVFPAIDSPNFTRRRQLFPFPTAFPAKQRDVSVAAAGCQERRLSNGNFLPAGNPFDWLRFSLPMRKLLRYWLPVVAWAAVIFLLSTGTLHGGFTYRLVRASLQFFFPEISSSTVILINTILRKAAHLLEYFILSLLLWRALRQDALERWRWRWTAGTLAICLTLASLDEWRQTLARTRTGSLLDVGFDLTGGVLAQTWLWWRKR